MIEFYPEVRLVHIWAVIASGTLFALRGLALNLGAAWPKAAPLRRLSYTIDTVLLIAALMLMTLVQQYPFVDAWLTVKRSEEHTSELQSLMRISYAVFCLKKT